MTPPHPPRRRRYAGHVRRWIADLASDARYAVRQLRTGPGAAAVMILTLGVGIGGTVTMASVIDRLLLRFPAQLRDPARLVRLVTVIPPGSTTGGATLTNSFMSYPAALDLDRQVRAFNGVAAFENFPLSLGVGPDAIGVRASLVSDAFFSVLGGRAALGRLFGRDGSSRGAPPTEQAAVLGYDFWNRQFGGDRAILGRSIRVGQGSYTVIGIAASGFRGIETRAPDLWLPLAAAAPTEAPSLWFAGRGSTWLRVVARLAPGATMATATEEVTALWRHGNPGPPGLEPARIVAASIQPGHGPDAPREVRVLVWLFGVSGLVLLLACANVANLLLGRAYHRRREIAVRLALGATRGRLARQLLVEGILLASLGAVLAVGLALAGRPLLEDFLIIPDAARDGRSLDLSLLATTAAIGIATGVLVGLAPLLQTTRRASANLAPALHTGAGGGAQAGRVRQLLVSGQAALCVVLVVGAALFGLSLHRVEQLDLGLDVDHTVMVRLDMDHLALPRPELDEIYRVMRARVAAIPGVAAVAFAEQDPYRHGRAVGPHAPDQSADDLWRDAYVQAPMEAAVDSGFFHAVGAASLRGRDFDAHDRRGSPRVAIINELLAKKIWPGKDPLGRCMLLSSADRECVTVVGVISGFWRRSILDRNLYLVYVPLAQRTVSFGNPSGMFIHVSSDAPAILEGIRTAIQQVRSDLPAVRISRMRDVIDPELRPWRLAATVFGMFGVVALIISAVGLYGVVAFNVAQRSAELALRLALGARARHVLRAAAGEGLAAAGVGLAVGTGATLGLRHWVGTLLFQTSASDPIILMSVVALLFVVAIAAVLRPTVRVLRGSPAVVLRAE